MAGNIRFAAEARRPHRPKTSPPRHLPPRAPCPAPTSEPLAVPGGAPSHPCLTGEPCLARAEGASRQDGLGDAPAADRRTISPSWKGWAAYEQGPRPPLRAWSPSRSRRRGPPGGDRVRHPGLTAVVSSGDVPPARPAAAEGLGSPLPTRAREDQEGGLTRAAVHLHPGQEGTRRETAGPMALPAARTEAGHAFASLSKKAVALISKAVRRGLVTWLRSSSAAYPVRRLCRRCRARG